MQFVEGGRHLEILSLLICVVVDLDIQKALHGVNQPDTCLVPIVALAALPKVHRHWHC